MFCKNCGKEITSNDKFCKECGTLNDNYVEGNPSIEEAMAQTQPYSIEDVANIVENNEAPASEAAPVETPTETPVVEEPVAPAPEVDNTQTGFVPEQPVIPAAPVMESAPVQPKKKSNAAFIVIIIVLGVLIVGLGVFIAIKFLGGKKETPTVQTPSTPITPSTPTTPTKPTQTDSTYTASGYKFTIPTGFELKTSNGTDMIVNGSTIVIGAFRTTTTYNYDYFKSNLNSFAASSQSSWNDAGYTMSVENGEATVTSGKKLLYNQRLNPTNKSYADVVITELPDKTILIVEFYYMSEADADPGYEAIASIAKSAVKDSTGNFATEPSNEVDFSKKSTYKAE